MKNDGGSVFPSEQGHTPEGLWNVTVENGMSLRDWFAGLAMQALINFINKRTGDREVTSLAYKYADEMLRAREVRDEKTRDTPR
jgi:hypothetical protein